MNTANTTNTKAGSESRPAMTPKQLQRWDEIQQLRALFCGGAATLIHDDSALGAQVYRRAGAGIVLAGFSAKRTKPDFHFSFRTPESADRYVTEWVRRVTAAAADRQARKAERSSGHQLVVGDVLRSSWGYDQTNIDYYQVTRLVGKQSVELRPIGRTSEATGDMSGDCVPAKDVFLGDAMVRRVNANGSVKVRSSGVWASKVTPVKVAGVEIFKPDSFTSYH